MRLVVCALVALLVSCCAATLHSAPRVGTLDAAQLSADLTDSSGSGPQLDAVLYLVESTLHALYELCRIDPLCASRFYLALDAQVDMDGNGAARLLQTADDDSERTKFYREVVFWMRQDDCPLQPNAVRGQVTLSDYRQEDAPWWLTVLSTARICEDNQQWETGIGCVVKPDRVDEDGVPVRAKSTLDSVGQPLAVMSVAIFAILILGAIVGAIYIVDRKFDRLINAINGAQEMFRGVAPADSSAMRQHPSYLFTRPVAQAADVHDMDARQHMAANEFLHSFAPQ